MKYLGVFIDETFTWKEQVKYVTNKIRKLIFKFYELRNVLSFTSLKSVYMGLVESILSYGIVVWGSAGTTILKKLEVTQKWIIKIILFKNKRYSTQLVYKDSGFLNLNQLYIKAVIRFMLKSSFYKNTINHGLNTRNVTQQNLALPNPKHTICQSHIYCVGPKVYNNLPASIRTRPYYKCKKEIIDWILSSNYRIDFVT